MKSLPIGRDVARHGLGSPPNIKNIAPQQWRIYIESKEAVLEGPRTHWAPQIYQKIMSDCS